MGMCRGLALDAAVPIKMTSTAPLRRDTDLVGTGRVGANEYVFALSAHSSHRPQKDLSLFIARQIFRCRNGSCRDEDGGFGKGITGQTSEKLEVTADDTYIPDVLREDEAARATFQTL